jgi:tetratricopeptide (TPR) repeat protein
MGQVMLARDLIASERLIAVKLLLPEFRDSTSEFMREYSVQRRLDHPSIPKVYDFGFGQHAGREVPYFAMDYVRGVPLANAFLQMKDPTPGYGWILQVLRGLDHLHRAGYLHRDLKPSNVLVAPEGEPENSSHLIDFGIAISFDETPEELFIGTPEYSAPELMAGSPFDARQDLYAVGLLLYELVSGSRPWLGEDPTDLYNKRMYGSYAKLSHPACPPPLSRLVDDLLRPNTDHRPKTAAEVIERFNDALKQPAPIETAFAFRRRLETVFFAESDALDEVARAWLGEGPSPHPVVLILEDPAGFDGARVMHELTDRTGVGGARVIRYALEPRPHGPLEAIEPVLALLRRLREARGGAPPLLGGLAGAATLLTRLPGAVVIAIEGINWADTLSLELFATLFTGAKNPGLRVIATIDPAQTPVAERALERLRALPVTRYVARDALTLEAVTDWVDEAVGTDVVPELRIAAIWAKSEGKPQRVRELLAEDLRRGALIRGREGFTWDSKQDALTSPDAPQNRVRALSQPMLPSLGQLQSLENLLSVVVEAVPEGVMSTFLAIPSVVVRRMVADGQLERDAAGWTLAGPRGPRRGHRERLPVHEVHALHERLARALELAPTFEGKAERVAREWLRSGDPLKAIPHLLDAAQRAGIPRQVDILPRAAALLDDARKILDREEALLAQSKDFERHIERLRGLRLALGTSRVKLARALGDWPSWQRAATELFERALETAHVPTMEAALKALMHLAADRGADDEMLRHAKSLSELSRASSWAIHWAQARVDASLGKPELAIERLRRARQSDYSAEHKLELLGLEAEILTQLGWVSDAQAAVKLEAELATRNGDVAATVHARLLGASLLRESHAPDRALSECRRLSGELGDQRYYRLDGRISLELARSHVEFGWYETAREHLAQAVALARRDGDMETLLAARLTDARVVAILGRPERAFHQIEIAREDASGLGRVHLRELEFAELEIGLAAPAGKGPGVDKLLEASKRLAEAARAEGMRALTIRAFALSARAALSLGLADDGLNLAQTALDLASDWEVGLSRHQLLFLLARARHVRGDGFRARRILGQAKAQLQQVSKILADAQQRTAFMEEPHHARIEAGDLAVPGPLSRRAPRPS